jgi:hypothetical protein
MQYQLTNMILPNQVLSFLCRYPDARYQNPTFTVPPPAHPNNLKHPRTALAAPTHLHGPSGSAKILL